MKRILLLILIFLGCQWNDGFSQHLKLMDSLDFCNIDKKEASQDLEKGHLYYIILSSMFSNPPRYINELDEILKVYKVELKEREISDICKYSVYCYKFFMDSVLQTRFGANFIKNIENSADSLFVARRDTKIFNYWEIDVRPLIQNKGSNFIFDPFIAYLNTTLDSTSQYRYESNCINVSHFIIEFTVDSLGKTSDCAIIEEQFINNEDEMIKNKIRQELIKSVNKISFWTPGILKGYKISTREHRGTAISWKK